MRLFHEQGYLAGVRILSDEQVEALREELACLVDPAHPGNELFYEYNSNESADPAKVLFHALGAWRITPGFHDVLWNPAFTVPASQLLGGAVRFWHDQLFCKPAHHGGVVAWHQDYSYWTRTQPMSHLTCWIGLDDATRDNGCLQYVPGSHRWQLLPITGLAGDMNAIQAVLSDEQKRQFKPVADRIEERPVRVPSSDDGSRLVRKPHRRPAARDRDQRLPRWRLLVYRRRAAGRGAHHFQGPEDGRPVLSAVARSGVSQGHLLALLPGHPYDGSRSEWSNVGGFQIQERIACDGEFVGF